MEDFVVVVVAVAYVLCK